MMEYLSHGEVTSLLAAYALDAVEPDERAAIEAHLSSCSICVMELADHLRVSAELARAERENVDGASRLLRSASPTPSQGVRPRHRATLAIAALALAVLLVAVTFGVDEQARLARLERGVRQAELTSQVGLALANPDSRHVILRNRSGQAVLSAVAEPTGSAYVFDSALPRLAKGLSYELWRVDNHRRLPAAALGPNPQPARFTLTSTTSVLAITVEAGATLAADHVPVAAGSI